MKTSTYKILNGTSGKENIMIAVLIIIAIFLFFIMCVLSAIRAELEKTRLENREIINVINKKK